VTPKGDPLLLVTVGTDHHPFDRLVQWVDGWLATPGGCATGLHCLMQTGTWVPPTGSAAGWQDYLEFEVLQAAMRDAAAVVCHGGPGTILGARHMGTVPIVVPRRRRLGEHVDDHQVAFSRPAAFRARFEHRGTATAVRAFERLVDDLAAGRPTPRQEIPDEVVR
jgi:UDP-N-acetylglucosamine transferase subunit ALG13